MERKTLEEHARGVMVAEAKRRGVTITFPEPVPDHIPEDTRQWLAHVEGKGWCYFAAPGFGHEVALPAEHDFLPVNDVLATNYSLFYGTVVVKHWPKVAAAPRRA
ncbi:hypothetical protein ACFOVU_03915 [Nocardiopsis sediminis]|uniref:Uncharacterized protein n=1 Tax=Nocardiopsis sediminis TaxID=1778267 RepID=A0ABV8FFW6_9ACTN